MKFKDFLKKVKPLVNKDHLELKLAALTALNADQITKLANMLSSMNLTESEINTMNFEKLFEGGNTTITTKGGVDISAERIPLKEIGRDNFVKKFQKFLLQMNKEFYKEYKYYIWEDEKEIMNGGIFNGSTSFIMNPSYDSNEIVKYKPSAGDLDIAIPRELGKDIYRFLDKHEGKEFTKGIRYIGNNANSEDKLGNTIICICSANFGNISVQAQMDLELSDFTSGSLIKGYIENGIIFDENGLPISTENKVTIVKEGW